MPGILVIRADGGTEIGAGHIMRCLALAQEWQSKGGEVVFISHCDTESLRDRIEAAGIELIPVKRTYPDPMDLELTSDVLRRCRTSDRSSVPVWAVLDGYHFSPDYQRALKETGCKLMVVDDMAHLPYYHADVILNQNIHAWDLNYLCNDATILLLGNKYVLIRPDFYRWRERIREIPIRARRVLITLGGTDRNNVTTKVIRALARVDIPECEALVVVGPANLHVFELLKAAADTGVKVELLRDVKDMPRLMCWADVAVIAGGGTAWESAFMGLPSLTVVLADNQSGVVDSLSRISATIELGLGSELRQYDIRRAMARLMNNRSLRRNMRTIGTLIIDGQGARRCVDALVSAGCSTADPGEVSFRSAGLEDALMLWYWANDPDTRSSSFSSELIQWDTHWAWFNRKLASPDSYSLILDQMNISVGQIRYDCLSADTARVSYSVARHVRNTGIGTKILKLSAPVARSRLGIKYVEGLTKEDNKASIRCLVKAGFQHMGKTLVTGKESLLFRKACE